MNHQIYDYLRDCIVKSGKKQKDIAAETGIQQASLSRFMSGRQSTLNADTLITLLNFFGLDICDALSKTDTLPAASAPSTSPQTSASNLPTTTPVTTDNALATNYIFPSFLDLRKNVKPSMESAKIAFKEEFLIEHQVNLSQAAMAVMQGDSMTPLIRNGDMLLIDLSQLDFREGGIYAVSFGDMILIKKVQRILNGWQLCNENHAYAPVPIIGSELRRLRVYGQVKWFGRML